MVSSSPMRQSVQQVAVVGLVHPQLPLHRRRGQPDLVALDPGPSAEPSPHLEQLDLVRILQREIVVLLGERLDRLAARVRAEQHPGDLLARLLDHQRSLHRACLQRALPAGLPIGRSVGSLYKLYAA
jgi:hypothetical protein